MFSAVEYDDCDTIDSMDSIFYDGLLYDKRTEYKEKLINNYNGGAYGKMGALIAFYYNTPNCSVGTIWKSDYGWIPLFPRMFDGKGHRPEIYELDKLIEQDKENTIGSDSKKSGVECAIYVEGKVMELFFSGIAERYNHFGYKSLNIVSIGPFYSDSLIENLKNHALKTWFVTNEPKNSQTPHAQNILKAVKEDDLVRISDIMEYFDLEKIKKSEKFSRVIDVSMFDEEMTEEARNSLLEMKLFKPQYRIGNMNELIENCTNDGKITNLIDTFKKKEETL